MLILTLRTLLVYLLILLAMRLMGKRQLGELCSLPSLFPPY